MAMFEKHRPVKDFKRLIEPVHEIFFWNPTCNQYVFDWTCISTYLVEPMAYFSTKTYAVGTQKNRPSGMVLLSA